MTATASTFKTHEPALHELLSGIHKGEIQLPDFQRGWVWEDDRIRALLASVSVSYPIGVVMLLETGGEGVRFKPRKFEGVSASVNASPQRLVLDGQQRLTSLYMVLQSGHAVATRTDKGKEIERVYRLRGSGDEREYARQAERGPGRRAVDVGNSQGRRGPLCRPRNGRCRRSSASHGPP